MYHSAVELGWREATEKTVFTNALDVVSKTDNGPREYYKDNTITNGNKQATYFISFLIFNVEGYKDVIGNERKGNNYLPIVLHTLFLPYSIFM